MPELPDITIYVECIERLVVGKTIQRVRLMHPFLLRTVLPPLEALVGLTVRRMLRLGKRIVFGMDSDLYLVLHLMIAGRLHWKPLDATLTRKTTLAALEFEHGMLVLTEAGSKRRATLHVVEGESNLAPHQPGGLEVLSADLSSFRDAIVRENRTLKRALTDPRILSGIGNAYSDEILHRANLSPVTLTRRLSEEAMARLHAATREVLIEWIERFRTEVGNEFPEKVTAFRPDMAVHGRFGKPCPVCGTKVQRIVHAENESNYCPRCQTGGKLLADRSLSRLLHDDWPRTIEELEDRQTAR